MYLQPGTPEVTYRLTFHLAPGKITASSRTYRKVRPMANPFTVEETKAFVRLIIDKRAERKRGAQNSLCDIFGLKSNP